MRPPCINIRIENNLYRCYRMPVIDIKDEASAGEFKRMVEHEKVPTMLLIHASWCGHCKHLMPTWNALENEPLDSVLLAKVEENDQAFIDKKYSGKVNGFPTILLIKNGEIEHYADGRSKDELLAAIKELSGGVTQSGGKRYRRHKRTQRQRQRGGCGCSGGSQRGGGCGRRSCPRCSMRKHRGGKHSQIGCGSRRTRRHGRRNRR